MVKNTIAMIGAGNMGASLLGGLITTGYAPQQLWIADPDTHKLASLQQQFHIHITTNNVEAIQSANVIILAVKPKCLPAVAHELVKTVQQQRPLIISVAAGVREASLNEWLGGTLAVVRCMPNTPALIGCAASVLYASKEVSFEQRHLAESIIRSVGTVTWLEDENLMDAVTALSGCGPAYFFLVIESLQQAAEKLGLPAEIARLLSLQTAYGATRMALESDKPAAVLRQQVMSPGGATEQAIQVLEEKNIRKIFAEALEAAKKRSEELALQKIF